VRWIFVVLQSITLSAGEVTFSPSIPLTDHLWHTTDFVAFDLDQDGDLDLIGSEYSGSRLTWWLNDGAGNFEFGHEWMWEEDLTANVLAMGDFDEDAQLEILFSPEITEENQAEALLMADWRDGSITVPEVASSLIVEGGGSFHSNHVGHLNGDGIPDFIDDGRVYLSSPDLEYVVLEGLDWGLEWDLDLDWETIVAEVDDDEIREIFDASESNEIRRYDLSMTEPMTTRVIARIPDGESLKSIGFHPATNEILSFSSKNLREGPRLPGVEDEFEMIIRAHPSDGSIDTIPRVIRRMVRLGYRGPFLFFHLDELSQRLVVNEWFFDKDRSRLRAEYLEVIFEDQEYEIIEIIESDFITYTAPPLFRDLNGDEMTDLVLPFSSFPRAIASFVDQLSWLPGDESDNGFSEVLESISTEGLAHDLKYFGDIDGDGDNDFLTQFTEPLNSKTRGMVGFWENDGVGNFKMHKISIETDNLYGTIDVIQAVDVSGSPAWLSEVPGVSNDWPEGRMDFIVRYQDAPDGSPPPPNGEGVTFIRYLLQDSLGVFHFSDVGASEAKSPLASYRLFDWNRDGNDELLAFIRNRGSNLTQLWLAKFEGIELKDFAAVFSEVRYPHVIDLDQDGLFDLVSSDGYFGGNPYWLRNDGSNSSPEAESLSFDIVPAGYDLDRDGYEDFRGINEDWSTFFLPGALKDGGDSNGEPRSYQRGSYDIDDDGDLDQIYHGIVDRVSSFLRFEWDETLEVTEERILRTRRHEIESGAQRLSPLKEITGFGDIDGDGTSDLLVVSKNRIEWFKITHAPQPEAFSQRMSEQGVTGHSAGLNLDYDFDGRSNWEEFAFGSHPAIPEQNSSALPGIRMGDNGMEFSFLFRSDAEGLGLTWNNFRSSDFKNWILMNENPLINPVESEYQRISYPLTPGLGREFFQTIISPPPAE